MATKKQKQKKPQPKKFDKALLTAIGNELNDYSNLMRDDKRKAKDKFMCKVDEVGVLLADNPYLGPVEPLLADLPSGYRSIVVAKLNKIIYRIVDNRIEIADLWDCRREPETLAGQLK